MTTKESGCGILPDFESEEFQRWWNAVEEQEERQRREAAAEEAREAALQRLYDAIDANLSPHLKAELAAENETARVTPKQKADFANFRATCTKWGMPYLPAMPQAVALFLTEGDADTVSRRCKSISVIHRSGNPTHVKTCWFARLCDRHGMKLKLTQTNRKQVNYMAIYNKGSRPYRGPYSPDFKGDDVGNYQSGTSDPNAYDPTNDVAALRAGRPTAPNYDGRGIDCSQTIDRQASYNHAFDADKNANWSRDKSDDSLGGFSGDLLPGGRGNNHPRRGQVKKDTL